MKKVLFATTALGMLAASAALAEGPAVSLGGYADFQVGASSQDSAYEDYDNDNGIYTRKQHSRTDSELHVKVDGKTDAGLGYGAYIELEADVNSDDVTGANNNAERSYIYVESGFGRVELGPNTDAASALRVDASTLARATGGVGGDFYHYVDLDGNTTGTTLADTFIVKPGLPTENFPADVTAGNEGVRATANKLTYYSPRISGLQLGVSYTPDQAERGTANGFSGDMDGTSSVSFENVWNLGLNYQGQYDAVGVEASVTADIGDAEDGKTGSSPNTVRAASTFDDLSAYNAGLSLAYAGFTLGGSYASFDEFGQTKTANTDASYWTVGLAYEFGPFAASVTYLDSTVTNGDSSTADKQFDNLSVGADYQLAPGLVPYVEVSFFDTDDNTVSSTDNNGSVFLVGTQVNF